MISSRARAISNVRWVAASQIGRIVIQLIGTIAFSRLLPPADFGLLAMAMVILNLAYLLRDMGTAAAVIQREHLTGDLLDTVFWLNLGFGVLILAVLLLFSPLIAQLFHEPRLNIMLPFLGLAFPITATGTLHLTLIERKSQFHVIAAIELSSSLLGLLIALAAALNGASAYSLAIQILISSIISTLLLWFVSKWRPTLRWRYQDFKSLWEFSGNLVAFNFITYFARNMDSMLVGSYLGATNLGFYNLAYRIMLVPVQNLSFVVNRALLPIYSRDHTNLSRLASQYVKTLSLISAVTFPLMLGLWSVREQFVDAFLGYHWRVVSSILAWFAPMACLQALTSTIGSILTAIGRTDSLRQLGLQNTAVLIVGFLIGLQFGLMGIVAAYCLSMTIVTALSFRVALRHLELGARVLFENLWRPAVCALTMAFLVRYIGSTLSLPIPTLIELLGLVLAGAGFYICFLWWSAPALTREIMMLLSDQLHSKATSN